MHTAFNESKFPSQLRGVSDGSVSGTRFYSHDNRSRVYPGRCHCAARGDVLCNGIRFPADYGIRSFVMRFDDTITVNVLGND